MITLSIITVNLNNRDGLKDTLQSIREQSSTRFEHIVIDGGSTDGSLDVIRKHEKHIAHWVSEPDRGIYHAMNKGIDVARGEFLLFLNSGDRLNGPDTISKAETGFKDADILYGNMLTSGSDESPDRWKPGPFTLFDLYKSTLPHSSTYIRKRLFTELGKYNERYLISSDYDFFLKAFLSCRYSFRYIDEDLSVFNRKGLSSRPENKKMVKNERRKIIEMNFPATLLPDYDTLYQYSEVESKYGKYGLIWAMKNRLIRNFIQLLYRFLKRIGICTSHKSFWENV